VDAGETIMAAAERSGHRWPTTCNGEADCGICAFVAEAGEDRLSPVAQAEATALALVPVTRERVGRTVRLACQVRVSGDVTVTKRGVKPVTG
jgi:2Fe-2S ferredoxin